METPINTRVFICTRGAFVQLTKAPWHARHGVVQSGRRHRRWRRAHVQGARRAARTNTHLLSLSARASRRAFVCGCGLNITTHSGMAHGGDADASQNTVDAPVAVQATNGGEGGASDVARVGGAGGEGGMGVMLADAVSRGENIYSLGHHSPPTSDWCV